MAAAIDCNGFTVLKMRLRAPLAGAWWARLDATVEAAITGAVAISDGTNTWNGTVTRSGVVQGICSALIVGGAGKLGLPVPAKSYVGVPARLVVQDLLAAAGEQADGVSLTRSPFRTVLEHWTRIGDGPSPSTAGQELTRVLEHVGATWRLLPSGAVWMGEATFTPSTPAGLVERDRDPSAGRVFTTLDLLDLLPASVVGEENVGDVEYELDGSELRATHWLEAA